MSTRSCFPKERMIYQKNRVHLNTYIIYAKTGSRLSGLSRTIYRNFREEYMNTPTIETERLILRRFSENDLEALHKIYSDEEVNKFLPWFPLHTLE